MEALEGPTDSWICGSCFKEEYSNIMQKSIPAAAVSAWKYLCTAIDQLSYLVIHSCIFYKKQIVVDI